ncbi:MAG TPA: protein kinase [Candidatus Polarisedimenticolia bacterium]|nr:protein kinase [Candidatus Polarisedimenticolia bacterium]
MSWPPGTKLGPYEIIAPLGAGGMGEVHRARDTRLNRDVAIKAIPATLAGDETLRQRFEREAKAISSLNHPHICTLYDVGRAPMETAPGGAQVDYLVMELLEGESLADRLVKGPMPIHEVLKIGAQIASALEAAHRQGIIHRDLKPGNIMLTRTGAKLLDFGLARTAAGAPPPVSAVVGSSQVATAMQSERPLTAKGTIIGTFQYMAPEQLEGTEADARTDIFSLGAVLYEMATGKRAFQGGSMTSLIAAIVSSQPPPIKMMVPVAPAALDHVVKRCLEKDPADRWQSAHDVGAELQWIAEAGSQAEAAAPVVVRRNTREALAWGLAAALGVAVLGLALGYLWRSAPAPMAPGAFRATLLPPPGNVVVPFDLFGLALSPDGKTLAFVASAADGRRQLWLRRLSEMEARAIGETAGASYPFWSPDGRNLAFFAEGKLKTIDLRGGSPRVLAEAPTGRGGDWGADGTILFAPNLESSILRVSSRGGEAKAVTTYDPKTESTQRWPVFLPDGRHFIYLSRARVGGRDEVGRLMLASLDGSKPSLLIEDASNARYVEPGYLIYGRAATLYAWRFDAKSLRLEGEAAPIVPEKVSYMEPKNFVPFAAGGDGTLVFLPESRRATEMRWYDRQGRQIGSLGPPGYYVTPKLSPDGTKVAYMQSDANLLKSNIWVRELESSRTVRLSQQAGSYANPVWSPDGARIVFQCQPKGIMDLCVAPVGGGSGEPQVLYASVNSKAMGSWMPDGQRLVFSEQDPKTDMDIMMLPVGGGEPTPLVRTPFTELMAQVSSDGTRMAFTSNVSGRFEIYVRKLSGGEGQWQISTEGGRNPKWRADGRELFYEGPEGALMAVPWQDGPGTPAKLFNYPERTESLGSVLGDATHDGQRFLLNVPVTSLSTIGFHAITHWPSLSAAGK